MENNNYQGALQHPINSGFNANSTSQEVISGIDLTGKTAIVTGGNAGIGLETTLTLAKAGANVVVLARDIKKAKQHLAGMANVHIAPIDLMDPVSIDTFTQKYLSEGKPLDILLNNAGIMWVPLRRDERGYESQLATNYLAQFQLTAQLWPALRQSQGARVINLSSQGHQFATFDFEDPNFLHRPYESLVGYGQSKTAVNLFSMEMDRRAKAFNVRVFSVHPGAIAGTELAREATIEQFQQLGIFDAAGQPLPEVIAMLKSIPQGAATSIWCATSPLLEGLGGVYCEDVNVADIATETNNGGVAPYSIDSNNAKRLWDLSEKLTGIKFLSQL